jgi:hypothetical protein
MKNDREFSGTLLGFDDFVSASPPFPLLIRLLSARTIDLSILFRYGLGGRDRIVRSLVVDPIHKYSFLITIPPALKLYLASFTARLRLREGRRLS